MIYPALFAHSLADQTVQCNLCPHRCILRPGETGHCYVRSNQGGKLVALNYGKPAVILVEPIEKKTLFHFHPGTQTLSLGTSGCNLRCAGCINWRISQSDLSEKLVEMLPSSIVTEAQQKQVSGIAFTFTEPAIFFEYARDIAHLAHSAGMYTIAKSNGFMLPEVLKAMSTWVDAINIDLKGWHGPLHRQIVGGNVGPVLHSLKLASRLGLWLEVSTLLVPGFNDDPQTMSNMARFIADELGPHVPWHLLRFFPEYQQADLPPTSQSQLGRALEIGQNAGLHHIYTQTLSHGEWLQTRCPKCQEVMVEREHNQFLGSHLNDGHCGNCGERLAGHWGTIPISLIHHGDKNGQ